MQPESVEQLAELIRSSTTLTVHSRGSSGESAVDLSKWNRVLDYPAADMTITVQSGMTVAALHTALAENGQHLPIDIPEPDTTTIGDAVAWDLNGSRRFGYGTLRDYVIGISAIDGQGRCFKSGGRVVKNVAGYDLCKLLIGSHGTLGAITQVTFKVLPKPGATGGIRFAFNELAPIEVVLEQAVSSVTRPVVIDIGSAGTAYELTFGFAGTQAEVAWQQQQISSEVQMPHQELCASGLDSHLRAAVGMRIPGSDRFLAGMRPSILIRFLQQAGCSRFVAHAGNGIVVGETDAIHAIKSMAVGLGGWCRENSVTSSPLGVSPILSTVRKVFDPDEKLNRHFG